MAIPANWQNPINVQPGQTQTVAAALLLPSRHNLVRLRLEFQKQLRDTGTARLSAVEVTQDGVIWDGHHAVRAFAERNMDVEVLVTSETVKAAGMSILD